MRMIVQQPFASFQPWWIIGSDMKNHLMALGVAAEEFKSFHLDIQGMLLVLFY